MLVVTNHLAGTVVYFNAAPWPILIQGVVCSQKHTNNSTSHSEECLRGTGLSVFFLIVKNNKLPTSRQIREIKNMLLFSYL